MAYPIQFLSLQKSELLYEVELRGGSGDSVQDLRKQITKLMQINGYTSDEILESHLEPSDDLKAVKESLSKAQNNITALKAKFEKNLCSRTENLLNHLYHRINRITNIPEVSELYKTCVSHFNILFKDFSTIKDRSSPAVTQTSTCVNASESSKTLTSCDHNVLSDISKIKFSGKTCVRSFIEKIEEFCISRGINYDKILFFAFEIFADDALHWYRCIKDNVKSWDDLSKLLKDDFSTQDYDYRLLEEIRSRTQGANENITIYLSIMHGMFSRLQKSISKEDKLEILLHNIRPCYASTLASSNITSIDDLKRICRKYEIIQSRLVQFREPPGITANTIAPEFAYNYNSQSENSPSAKLTYNNNSLKLPNTISTNKYCPRCRCNSHSLKECSKARFIICFKCGKNGVRFPDCPICNPKPSSSKN